MGLRIERGDTDQELGENAFADIGVADVIRAPVTVVADDREVATPASARAAPGVVVGARIPVITECLALGVVGIGLVDAFAVTEAAVLCAPIVVIADAQRRVLAEAGPVAHVDVAAVAVLTLLVRRALDVTFG